MFGDQKIDQKIKFLNSTFKCKPPEYDYYATHFNWTSLNKNWHDDPTINECEEHGMCMWWMSRRFCNPPFCWKNV